MTAIRQAVLRSGRSQRSISEEADVPASSFSEYLNEKQDAMGATIDRLLVALKLSVKPENPSGVPEQDDKPPQV